MELSEKTPDRKLYWRRVEAARVRKQRIIAGYIEIRHAEIYKEASEFYEALHQKYPKKKDFRKTNEFEWLRDETTRKFYTRKVKVSSTNNIQFVSEKVSSTNNIQLVSEKVSSTNNIQLVSEKVSSTNNIQLVSEKVSSTDSMELIIPLMKLPIQTRGETAETNVVIEDNEVVIDSSFDNEVVIDSSFDKIPDTTLDEIIHGLREDPDLQSLFDDIDIGIEESSPLERELANCQF